MQPNPLTTVLIGCGLAVFVAAAGIAMLGNTRHQRRPSPQLQQLQQQQLPGIPSRVPTPRSIDMAGPGYGGQQFAP